MKVRELLTSWKLDVDQSTLDRFSRGIDLAKKAMVGAVVGVAALSAAILKLAHSAFEYIDSSEEMAQSAGVTTQFFQELAFAASRAGVSTEQLSTSLAFFQRNIHSARKGGKEASEAFRELGITQEELKKLGSEALFIKVADKLSKIEDPAKRGALAMAALGRGGAKLIPAFKAGAEGLAKIGDRARALGLVTGPEAEAAADALEASMGDLKGAGKGLIITLGTALMPIITDLALQFFDWYKINQKVITSKLKVWLVGVAKGIAETIKFVAALVQKIVVWIEEQGGLIGLFQKTQAFLTPLITLFVGLGKVVGFIINVLKRFADGLGALAAIWYQLFQGDFASALMTFSGIFKNVFGGVFAFFLKILEFFKSFWTSYWESIAGFFKEYVIAPIVAAWDAAIDFMMQKLNGAKTAIIETLNLLPGVNIGTQKIGESGAFQIPRAPLASVGTPTGVVGSPSASFSLGDINVSVGGSSAPASEIGGAVKTAVQDAFDRMFRHAGADMAR